MTANTTGLDKSLQKLLSLVGVIYLDEEESSIQSQRSFFDKLKNACQAVSRGLKQYQDPVSFHLAAETVVDFFGKLRNSMINENISLSKDNFQRKIGNIVKYYTKMYFDTEHSL